MNDVIWVSAVRVRVQPSPKVTSTLPVSVDTVLPAALVMLPSMHFRRLYCSRRFFLFQSLLLSGSLPRVLDILLPRAGSTAKTTRATHATTGHTTSEAAARSATSTITVRSALSHRRTLALHIILLFSFDKRLELLVQLCHNVNLGQKYSTKRAIYSANQISTLVFPA